ncbi:MAG: Flp family type IVb pilin [Elusimicrobiota bacterium]
MIKKQKRKFFENGNGLVEYILITALVVIASVAVFKKFQTDIRLAYEKVGKTLIDGATTVTTSDDSL